MRIDNGMGLTMRQFNAWKTQVFAQEDIQNNVKKFRNQITEADVEYIKNALEAPDVNQFLGVI